jgi:hypothetical protein
MFYNIDGSDFEYRIKLKAFIENAYSINITSIDEHNRGFYGETWKVESNNNNRYFIKIIYSEKHAKKYMSSFNVLDFMNANGIDFVSKVIKAISGKQYLSFNEGILAMFDFVDGIHAKDNPITFIPYLVRIYNLPVLNIDVEKEDFSTNAFLHLEQQVEKLNNDIEILSIINKNLQLLIDVNDKQKHYSQLCKNKQKLFVITSGDIGGNSLVVDDKIKIIDCDWIKLAPPERDLWWYVQDLQQITDINISFQREGFNYSLDNEILGYYTFFSFIYFLTEIIDSFLFNPISRPEVIKKLIEHFEDGNCMLKCMENIRHLTEVC